MKMDQV